jgi:TolB-like protein/Tfp pilus assembly protein PilF
MAKIENPDKPAKAEKVESLSDTQNSSGSNYRRYETLVGGVVAIAFVLAIVFGFWTLSWRLAPQFVSPASSSTNEATTAPQKSIAVLPFENFSRQEKDSFLAEALQDDILTALSQVAQLKVISRTSVNTYPAGAKRNLLEIGQALGVAHLLQGKVERMDEKINVTVELLDSRDGAREWIEKRNRDLSDIFAIEQEIAQQITTYLQIQVSPKEKAAMDARPTKDLDAYALYVPAKSLIATISFNAHINEQLRQAVELLDQAIARDPNFFLAYCQLSIAHNYLYFFGLDHTPARLALANSALEALIRLRPDAGETHFARANFLYRCHLDYEGARAEMARAQHALPNNAEIFELTGYIDRRQNLWSESARSLQKALDLDPRNFFMLQQIATSYQEFRQFNAMAAALDRALALVPRDLDARVTRALVDLEWKADTRPLHKMIDTILVETPDSAGDLADQWLYLALCERDRDAAQLAVASIPKNGTSTDLNFPRAWSEAIAARARGDAEVAQKAFRAARVEMEQTVREQPDYAAALCVLGLIDAGLGHKDEAIREGRRAVELLPITKDSIDGAELMKYLALIYTWCGEKDLAIDQIAATMRIPSGLSYGNLKLHPNWDALRGDSRFEKIVAAAAPKNVDNNAARIVSAPKLEPTVGFEPTTY